MRLARKLRTPAQRRSTVAHDMTTVTVHPTKGYRRVSGRRIVARMVMQAYGLREGR